MNSRRSLGNIVNRTRTFPQYPNKRPEVFAMIRSLAELCNHNPYLIANLKEILTFAMQGKIADPNERNLSPCEIARTEPSVLVRSRTLNSFEMWALRYDQAYQIMLNGPYAKREEPSYPMNPLKHFMELFRILQSTQIDNYIVKLLRQHRVIKHDDIDCIRSTSLLPRHLQKPLLVREEHCYNLDPSQYQSLYQSLFLHPDFSLTTFTALDLLIFNDEEIKYILQRYTRYDTQYLLLTPFFMIRFREGDFNKLDLDALIRAVRSEREGFLNVVKWDQVLYVGNDKSRLSRFLKPEIIIAPQDDQQRNDLLEKVSQRCDERYE